MWVGCQKCVCVKSEKNIWIFLVVGSEDVGEGAVVDEGGESEAKRVS